MSESESFDVIEGTLMAGELKTILGPTGVFAPELKGYYSEFFFAKIQRIKALILSLEEGEELDKLVAQDLKEILPKYIEWHNKIKESRRD